VTYRWKVLDEGYNFSSNLTSIGGFQIKLWAPKLAGDPTLGISRLPFGSLETKCHLDVVSLLAIEYTIRGKVMASPKSRLW